ncbi:DUF1877 family protein [Streptomyces sp. P9-A2]|uniref:DUF1877 family protein n=1 Tax=Streptomyces sp. P9-A2 TaxID=3072284 RepID=UPI002FCA6127
MPSDRSRATGAEPPRIHRSAATGAVVPADDWSGGRQGDRYRGDGSGPGRAHVFDEYVLPLPRRAAPALRNSPVWLLRLFEDDWDTVRERIGRHREEVLDKGYLDHEFLYAGALPPHMPAGPPAHVVLGGRPVFAPGPGRPPLLLLTAAQAGRVAGFLRAADFDALWRRARDRIVPCHGDPDMERQTRGILTAAHRDLTAFYTRTAQQREAVVKWLPP